MGKSLNGLVLGAIFGGIGSTIASAASAPDPSSTYTRNILCLVIGAGLWGVAGAIVGGTGAIIDAINRGRTAGTN